ncbi:uncharacterized protein LOC62_02G002944 [Vanrija pseudolonga]|uniref:Ubiquitin-like domain-containing protein n=1 Tax=Vanrija pseudolonga TaxID=143232 RepID=A0AAF1BGX1_9TREE|nr:hypothetical protein LOC62_02G002944 [Vanrija pseudolonga]
MSPSPPMFPSPLMSPPLPPPLQSPPLLMAPPPSSPTVDQSGAANEGGDQLPPDDVQDDFALPLINQDEDLRRIEEYMAGGTGTGAHLPQLEGLQTAGPAVLDIKPFIPDLVPIGVDFQRIRDPHNFPLYDPPGYYQIRLKGSKEHQSYVVKIWVTPTTTGGDLLNYLSDNFGYQPATVRLLYCGERLKATDTMTSIEMEPEGDIDVAVEMMGG